ncbi:SAMS2, partial [Symbiodinium sp. CCMP2456]
ALDDLAVGTAAQALGLEGGHWQQAVSLLVGRSEGGAFLRRALLRSCDAAPRLRTQHGPRIVVIS